MGVGRMRWDSAAGRTWRVAHVVVAAAVAAALLGACSTLAGLAGGAPPVRACAGLGGATGKEPFFGALVGRFGVAMTWLTEPDGSLYVSVYRTPVDRYSHDGEGLTFHAEGFRPGVRVRLTTPPQWGQTPASGEARFSPDGRSVVLSLPGRAPVTLTRMSRAAFDALLGRERFRAPPTVRVSP